jgi:UDP-glucose:(heptosyl)LPS alpha-1,3-glucosyltransferase
LSRDDILHWFEVDPTKLHVIYNGVDTEKFHPRLRQHRAEVRRRLGVPDDATLFIFVGSALRHKGLAVTIEGLAQTPDSYLVVVGKHKHAGLFLRQAQRLGIAERVKMAGVQADVAPYYGAADALVLPSLYDIFPNVALEAMATGLPVATSAKCGAAELIVEGENGYVRDALDGPGFAHALRQLADPRRRESRSRAARAAVEPLNLEATRRRLIQLYHDLLDERT